MKKASKGEKCSKSSENHQKKQQIRAKKARFLWFFIEKAPVLEHN